MFKLIVDSVLVALVINILTQIMKLQILLHNPTEIPKMAEFAFMVPPGFETRVGVKPIINDATPTLKSISITKRHCYFMDESKLIFFRKYTQINCITECLTNMTMKYCGCAPYYLPRKSMTKLCGEVHQSCYEAAEEIVALGESAEVKKCNCLAGCFQIDYEKSSSVGMIIDNLTIQPEFLRNVSKAYFRNNMAIVHIFYTSPEFIKYTKSELYGFSEFLSSTGGLLGLFLGFSALSLVEMLYHLTLKAICTKVRQRWPPRKRQIK